MDYNTIWQLPDGPLVPDLVHENSVVLVCGPKRNNVGRVIRKNFPNFLDPIGLDIPPDLSNTPAKFLMGGQEYIPGDEVDYAVVIVRRNPFNVRKRLTWRFGLKPIGTHGAGSFYTAQKYEDLRRAVEKATDQDGKLTVLLKVAHSKNYELGNISVVFPSTQ